MLIVICIFIFRLSFLKDIVQTSEIAQILLANLNCRDTISLQIATGSPFCREQIYWKSIEYNYKLENIEWLLKDQFEFVFDKEIEKLYDYINKSKYICVAGGYPTLMFLNRTLSGYLDSDIDIYIMEPSDIPVNTIAFIDFVNSNYRVSFESINASNCVYNIKLEGYCRTLQIICTRSRSINEIFYEYDMGYNKCGLYGGHTFVTFDALYSKKNRMTWTNKPVSGRINKAYDKGISVYGYDVQEESGASKKQRKAIVSVQYVVQKVSPIKKFMMGYGGFVQRQNVGVIQNNKIVDVDVCKEYRNCMLYYLRQCDYNIKYCQYMCCIGDCIEVSVRGKLMSLENNGKFFIEVRKEQNSVMNMVDNIERMYEIISGKYNEFDKNINIVTCDKLWEESIFHCDKMKEDIPYFYTRNHFYINISSHKIDINKLVNVRNSGLDYMMKLYIRLLPVTNIYRDKNNKKCYVKCINFNYNLCDITDILDNDNVVIVEDDYPFV